MLCSRLAPLVLALPLAGNIEVGPLTFAPEEGGSWKKSFTQKAHMEFDELLVVVNGDEVPAEALPELEVTVTEDYSVVVTDVFVKVGKGRPTELHRTFDEIEYMAGNLFSMISLEGETSTDGEATGESPLEGETVVFEWDADEEEYTRSFQDDGDAKLLEELVEDMDARTLLPDEDIEVGDSWKLDASAFFAFAKPGGDLQLEITGDESATWQRVTEDEEISGEATLTLKSVEDGIATVEIEGEMTVVSTGAGDLSQVPVAEGSATQTDTAEFEFEGTLRWDTENGLLQSLDIDSEGTVASHTEADEPGEMGTYEHTLTMSGTNSLRVLFERTE